MGLAEGWDWPRQHVDSVSDVWHKNVGDTPGVDTGTSGPWFPRVLLPSVSDRLPGPQTYRLPAVSMPLRVTR